MRLHICPTSSRLVLAAVVVAACLAPRAALAHKFMSLKKAITYFMPQGSKPYRVEKSIPAEHVAKVKASFRLQSDGDFKESLSEGPYTVYVARDGAEQVTAYILLLEQQWRTCYHKYAIGLSPKGDVKEVIVVELSCPYAYPVNRKSFLSQFVGKEASDAKTEVAVGRDIDGVSGATRSSDVTAIVTRRALALYDVFFAS